MLTVLGLILCAIAGYMVNVAVEKSSHVLGIISVLLAQIGIVIITLN